MMIREGNPKAIPLFRGNEKGKAKSHDIQDDNSKEMDDFTRQLEELCRESDWESDQFEFNAKKSTEQNANPQSSPKVTVSNGKTPTPPPKSRGVWERYMEKKERGFQPSPLGKFSFTAEDLRKEHLQKQKEKLQQRQDAKYREIRSFKSWNPSAETLVGDS